MNIRNRTGSTATNRLRLFKYAIAALLLFVLLCMVYIPKGISWINKSAWNGNMMAVRLVCWWNGPNVVYCDFNYLFPALAGSGNLEAVRYLVERGADVNRQSFYSGSALSNAAKSGNLEMVKYLVAQGATDTNALAHAVVENHLPVAKYLLGESGMNYDTALLTAIVRVARERSDMTMVEYLETQIVPFVKSDDASANFARQRARTTTAPAAR